MHWEESSIRDLGTSITLGLNRQQDEGLSCQCQRIDNPDVIIKLEVSSISESR